MKGSQRNAGNEIPIPNLRRQDKKNRQNSIDDIPDELKIKFSEKIKTLSRSK